MSRWRTSLAHRQHLLLAQAPRSKLALQVVRKTQQPAVAVGRLADLPWGTLFATLRWGTRWPKTMLRCRLSRT